MISLAEKEKRHWTCRIISQARRLFVKMNWPKFNSQECEAKKILSLSREANRDIGQLLKSLSYEEREFLIGEQGHY